jgi:hypothetical protein
MNAPSVTDATANLRIFDAVEEGFASIERVLTGVDEENMLFVFAGLCREEPVRWIERGYIAKPDAVDRLLAIGLTRGLDREAAETAIGDAFLSRVGVEEDVVVPFEAADRQSPDRSPRAALVLRRAADIVAMQVFWLWGGRVAIGKLTIVAGEPGLGKSQLMCAIAAVVTTGDQWPGGEGTAPIGSVIILSAEDDAADTIKPRLEAARADVEKIFIVSAVHQVDGKGRRGFNIQVDLELLEEAIKRIGDVRLVVIDPVSSYLGKVDSHRNAELRAVLEPLGEMAARLGVAIVAITHLNKAGGSSANSRFIGSIAFVAAARAAFIVARDPDDAERRLFLPTKNNLGPEGSGLGFRIGTVETPGGILAPMVMWDGVPVATTASEVLAGGEQASGKSARDEAEEFLRSILALGPMAVKEIMAEAEGAGLAWRTVRRAKDRLDIQKHKSGTGGWSWSRGKVATETPEDGQGGQH